jgi:molybdate transport system substrate-binding protein
MKAFLAAVVVAALAAGCRTRTNEPVRVFAAASLRESLSTIATEFESETGVHVVASFGASNALAVQIRAGAPADVFVSADEAQMDAVASLLEPDSRFDLLANRLSVVVNAREPASIAGTDDLRAPSVKRIAIADPSGVPAGVYAKQFLEASGLYGDIEGKVLRCNDVRGALAAVETGDADCGFVYRTDAAVSSRVRVAFDVLGPHAPSIRYPAARLRSSAAPRGADRFLRWLREPKATRVFAEAGFVLPT